MDTIERQAAEDDIAGAIATLQRAGMSVYSPVSTPTQRAEDAIERMAYDLMRLQMELRKGAVLSPQKRTNLAAFVTMLKRIGAVE